MSITAADGPKLAGIGVEVALTVHKVNLAYDVAGVTALDTIIGNLAGEANQMVLI